MKNREEVEKRRNRIEESKEGRRRYRERRKI